MPIATVEASTGNGFLVTSIYTEKGIVREEDKFTLSATAVNDSGLTLYTPYEESSSCGFFMRYPGADEKGLDTIFPFRMEHIGWAGADIYNATTSATENFGRGYQSGGRNVDTESLYFLNMGVELNPGDKLKVAIRMQFDSRIKSGETVYIRDFACDFKDSNGGTTKISFTEPSTEFAIKISEPVSAVYRFFNTDSGAHFYTSNVKQRNRVLAKYPNFKYEGVNYFAFNKNSKDLTPVYRFYNTQTGSHFYTASKKQRNKVIANFPQYKYEGVNNYVFAKFKRGRVPMYRFYNTATGTHFYTSKEVEKQRVLKNYPQFKYEGIAYYVPTEVERSLEDFEQ